jgi:hypothetical protein
MSCERKADRKSHEEKFAAALRSIRVLPCLHLLRMVSKEKKSYFDSPEIEIKRNHLNEIMNGSGAYEDVDEQTLLNLGTFDSKNQPR